MRAGSSMTCASRLRASQSWSSRRRCRQHPPDRDRARALQPWLRLARSSDRGRFPERPAARPDQRQLRAEHLPVCRRPRHVRPDWASRCYRAACGAPANGRPRIAVPESEAWTAQQSPEQRLAAGPVGLQRQLRADPEPVRHDHVQPGRLDHRGTHAGRPADPALRLRHRGAPDRGHECPGPMRNPRLMPDTLEVELSGMFALSPRRAAAA
jgi:hypothetical protein